MLSLEIDKIYFPNGIFLRKNMYSIVEEEEEEESIHCVW